MDSKRGHPMITTHRLVQPIKFILRIESLLEHRAAKYSIHVNTS